MITYATYIFFLLLSFYLIKHLYIKYDKAINIFFIVGYLTILITFDYIVNNFTFAIITSTPMILVWFFICINLYKKSYILGLFLGGLSLLIGMSYRLYEFNINLDKNVNYYEHSLYFLWGGGIIFALIFIYWLFHSIIDTH